MNLYQLTTEYRQLADLIESYEEVPEELEAKLSAIECSLDNKFDGCCALRREFRAEAEAAREEAKRLMKLAEVREHAAERIWRYLSDALTEMGIQSHSTVRFKAWFQKNPPRCEVLDPNSLPKEYQRIKIEADAKALVETWKNGGELPEGVQVTQSTSLRLK